MNTKRAKILASGLPASIDAQAPVRKHPQDFEVTASNIGMREKVARERDGSSTPISVAITTLNEQHSIGKLLMSLAGQTTMPQEILLVDAGSLDETVQVASQIAEELGLPLRIIVAPGATISAGRNIAISSVVTPYIAVTDAGTTLDPRWLEGLLGALLSGADMAAGWFDALPGSAFSSILGAIITPIASEISESSFLPSSRSVAFSLEVWERAGRYPEWLDYCEDLVFDLMVKRSGGKIRLAADAIAVWDARPTMQAFSKQYFRYARGDAEAGLWPRRHLLRSTAYFLGVWLLLRRDLFALTLGGSFYLTKFVRRIVARHRNLGSVGTVKASFLLVPVVVIGDLSKIAGYLLHHAHNRSLPFRGALRHTEPSFTRPSCTPLKP
jgi:glycosyltransferase involved in cell wall biosynthesis